MKSKGINLFALLGIVLGVIAVVVVLVIVLGNSGGAAPVGGGGAGSLELGERALQLESITEFREYAKAEGYQAEASDELGVGSIIGVPIMGEQAVVTYYFDGQGKTTDLNAFYFFNGDATAEVDPGMTELTAEDLAMKTRDAAERFCMMFGCNFVPDLYLYNYDGTFTKVESDADFAGIAQGTGELQLSIRDREGYFWQMSVSSMEGLASVNVRKFFDVDATKDYVASISLLEEE